MSDPDAAAEPAVPQAVALPDVPVKRGRGRPRKGAEAPRKENIRTKRRHKRSIPKDHPLLADGGKPRMALLCDCGAWNHISYKVCPTCKGLTPRGKKAEVGRLKRQAAMKAVNDRKLLKQGLAVGGAIYKAPDAELVDTTVMPHVVMKVIRQQVRDVLVELPVGRVITSLTLIRALLAEKAPIVPVSMADNLVCCPQCAAIFELPEKAKVKQLIAA